MRELLKRLEEHRATLLDPQVLYVYKDKKLGDLVDTDAWYSDRLHDALHAILDGIPEMVATSHRNKDQEWIPRKEDLSGDEAMQLYDKVVQAIEAQKGALGLIGGAEKLQPGNYVERVYAEKHGAAALEIVGDRSPKNASVTVIHYTPDNKAMYDLVRKAGGKQTRKPVPAKGFDFKA